MLQHSKAQSNAKHLFAYALVAMYGHTYKPAYTYLHTHIQYIISNINFVV